MGFGLINTQVLVICRCFEKEVIWVANYWLISFFFTCTSFTFLYQRVANN